MSLKNTAFEQVALQESLRDYDKDMTIADLITALEEKLSAETDAMVDTPFTAGELLNYNLGIGDGMTTMLLSEIIDRFVDQRKFVMETNKKIGAKKMRQENFRSEISENIAKFAIFKNSNSMPNWNTKKGDLVQKDDQLEVKGFTSKGPLSFGPTEAWERLYFVDGLDIDNKNFKVFEINLSNTAPEWRSLKLHSTAVRDDYGNFLKQSDEGSIPVLDESGLEAKSKSELVEMCNKRYIKANGSKLALIGKLKNSKPGSKFNIKTYGGESDGNRRGNLRAPFYEVIKPQVDKWCKLIWAGNITDLLK